jgi:hypothetical protein
MLNLPKWALVGTLLAATAAASVGIAFASGDAAPDAPNTVICPQTGEEISRDDCPLVDPDRPDCPGKIECPLTGELVCRDRCPLDAESQADGDGDVPACCKKD